MKLSKAIEILTLDVKGNTKINYEDWKNAIKLGIEAIQAWERIRMGVTSKHLWKLPSETEE